MQDEVNTINTKQVKEMIDAEVKPLLAKIEQLEKEIELLPINEKIENLKQLMDDKR